MATHRLLSKYQEAHNIYIKWNLCVFFCFKTLRAQTVWTMEEKIKSAITTATTTIATRSWKRFHTISNQIEMLQLSIGWPKNKMKNETESKFIVRNRKWSSWRKGAELSRAVPMCVCVRVRDQWQCSICKIENLTENAKERKAEREREIGRENHKCQMRCIFPTQHDRMSEYESEFVYDDDPWIVHLSSIPTMIFYSQFEILDQK